MQPGNNTAEDSHHQFRSPDEQYSDQATDAGSDYPGRPWPDRPADTSASSTPGGTGWYEPGAATDQVPTVTSDDETDHPTTDDTGYATTTATTTAGTAGETVDELTPDDRRDFGYPEPEPEPGYPPASAEQVADSDAYPEGFQTPGTGTSSGLTAEPSALDEDAVLAGSDSTSTSAEDPLTATEANPEPADHAVSDQAVTDQAVTDQAVTDPAVSGQALPGQALPGRTPDEGPLVSAPDADELRLRWREVQAGFVDDPADAVRAADDLVGELVHTLSERLRDRANSLQASGAGGGDTEQLRVALRRYRALFDRLLGL